MTKYYPNKSNNSNSKRYFFFVFCIGWSVMWFFLGRHTAPKAQEITYTSCHLKPFFTVPSYRRGYNYKGPLDSLVEYINQAKSQILVKAYGFTYTKLAYALLSAANRGVEVRILIDHSYEKDLDGSISCLYHNKNANISICSIKLPGGGISHDKMVLIDNDFIWIGSINLTTSGNTRNEENGLAIIKPEPELFNQYLNHWIGAAKSPDSRVRKPGKWGNNTSGYLWSQHVELRPDPKEIMFSVEEVFAKAKQRISIILNDVLSENIIHELREARRKGLIVEILAPKRICEDLQNKVGSEISVKGRSIGTKNVFIIDSAYAFNCKGGCFYRLELDPLWEQFTEVWKKLSK